MTGLKQWYVKHGDSEPLGPYSFQALKGLLLDGFFPADSLVWSTRNMKRLELKESPFRSALPNLSSTPKPALDLVEQKRMARQIRRLAQLVARELKNQAAPTEADSLSALAGHNYRTAEAFIAQLASAAGQWDEDDRLTLTRFDKICGRLVAHDRRWRALGRAATAVILILAWLSAEIWPGGALLFFLLVIVCGIIITTSFQYHRPVKTHREFAAEMRKYVRPAALSNKRFQDRLFGPGFT